MRQWTRIPVALVYVAGYTHGAQVKNVDVFGNFLFGLAACRTLAMVYQLIFQRTPKAFHRGIVPTIALTTHGRPHAKLDKYCLLVMGAILAAVVGM